jgi:hypothetical protein
MLKSLRRQTAAFHPLLLLGFLIAIGASFWSAGYRPAMPYQFRQPDGQLAPDPAMQSAPLSPHSWQKDGHTIQPLTSFYVRGRVLMNIPYAKNASPTAFWAKHVELSPLDLVVTWGPMSDSAELRNFQFAHGYRVVYLSPRNQQARRDAGLHLSHIHAIPATPGIRSILESFGPEDVVTLQGSLVSVTSSGANPWTSSLSREDNKCEIFWIDSAKKELGRPGLLEFWARKFREKFG